MSKRGRVALFIRLNAGNDVNGNPRRVYVALSPSGSIVGAWDEGYRGFACVPPRLRRKALQACTFNVTPREYRALLRLGRDLERAAAEH